MPALPGNLNETYEVFSRRLYRDNLLLVLAEYSIVTKWHLVCIPQPSCCTRSANFGPDPWSPLQGRQPFWVNLAPVFGVKEHCARPRMKARHFSWKWRCLLVEAAWHRRLPAWGRTAMRITNGSMNGTLITSVITSGIKEIVRELWPTHEWNLPWLFIRPALAVGESALQDTKLAGISSWVLQLGNRGQFEKRQGGKMTATDIDFDRFLSARIKNGLWRNLGGR